MPSTKKRLEYVLEQLSGADGVFSRPMMGEYVIYYRGKVIGGIYDDRFLVKPTRSARAMLPQSGMAVPYDGAKEMLLVEDLEDKDLLRELLDAVHGDLPGPKKRT